MPTIEASYKDLCNLIGRKIEVQKLKDEVILLAKGEVDDQVEDILKIDIKDTNRPDLWSAEGIAREIRFRYKKDFPDYKVRKSAFIVNVDTKSRVQPNAVCAVARNLKIDDAFLSQIIQLQEKLSVTFGRNRKEMSMGIYDLDKIKFPIKYTSDIPKNIKFVPLDFEKELDANQILEQHPKGKEFGHLLKGETYYPIWVDASGQIMAMPPIINSNILGKVDKKTRNVFIECTGHNIGFLKTAINVLAAQMLERGADVYEVKTVCGGNSIITPSFDEKKIPVDIDYINNISGLALGKRSIIDLLQKSGYKVKSAGDKLLLLYPAYRQDIMHARDVVEDILISYGYNNIEPRLRKLATKGQMLDSEIFAQKISEIMVGVGLQEILSYTLTNYHDLFEKMNAPQERLVEIENTISSNWSVFRTWLLPSVMDFLSKNRHVEYPQKIFEIGICVKIDEKHETKTCDVRKLAVAVTGSTAGYEDIASILDVLMRNIGAEYKINKSTHPSFINGRCAEIIVKDKSIGFIGEIHPQVLNNWKLDKPTAAFELNLDELQRMKQSK